MFGGAIYDAFKRYDVPVDSEEWKLAERNAFAITYDILGIMSVIFIIVYFFVCDGMTALKKTIYNIKQA